MPNKILFIIKFLELKGKFFFVSLMILSLAFIELFGLSFLVSLITQNSDSSTDILPIMNERYAFYIPLIFLLRYLTQLLLTYKISDFSRTIQNRTRMLLMQKILTHHDNKS